jgi:hypothetical protein
VRARELQTEPIRYVCGSAVIRLTYRHDQVRGRDLLGTETDEMLRDRIDRSRHMHAKDPWGVREGTVLPYEPRQGPVHLSGAELKWYVFEGALNTLAAWHGLEIEHDYEGAYVEIEGRSFYL